MFCNTQMRSNDCVLEGDCFSRLQYSLSRIGINYPMAKGYWSTPCLD